MRGDLPTGNRHAALHRHRGLDQLLHELGQERYAGALAEHRRILRAAFAGATEASRSTRRVTPSSSPCRSQPTAVEAATDRSGQPYASRPYPRAHGRAHGQAVRNRGGLRRRRRPPRSPYRSVRPRRPGARLAATASLAERLDLKDLGEHRLKDLSAPEQIYQLGTEEFPSLKTLHQTNLPIPTTPFLGRERELAEVTALLSQDDVRLLTLTGPGGTGKTRLAAQAAAALSDALPERDVVAPARAVARAGTRPNHGCAGPRLEERTRRTYRGQVDAPAFRQLRTGRRGRTECRRPPGRLPKPRSARDEPRTAARDTGAGISGTTARARGGHRLLHDPGAAVRPDYEPDDAVSEICKRLDDLPLALELAAARVKVLSSQQILDRLEQRLPLLTGGARDLPERQRTLRATIEWSYDLLEANERQLFRRLGGFSGGCTLEAAEQVAGAHLDTIQSLVDKSLVRYSGERYWMLETIREYAAGRLEEQVRPRNCPAPSAHFLALAEEADLHLAASWRTGSNAWSSTTTTSAPRSTGLSRLEKPSLLFSSPGHWDGSGTSEGIRRKGHGGWNGCSTRTTSPQRSAPGL